MDDKPNLSAEDIEFLKDLSKELKTQENQNTLKPLYWCIKGPVEILTSGNDFAGYKYMLNDGTDYIYNSVEECFEKYLSTKYSIEDSLDVIAAISKKYGVDESFQIKLENTLIGEGFAERAYYKTQDLIVEDAMFLTEKAAKEHLGGNKKLYEEGAYVHCCNAFRSPEFEKLLEIVEKF